MHFKKRNVTETSISILATPANCNNFGQQASHFSEPPSRKGCSLVTLKGVSWMLLVTIHVTELSGIVIITIVSEETQVLFLGPKPFLQNC